MKNENNKRDLQHLKTSLKNLKKEEWYQDIKNYLKYLSNK